MRVVRIDAGPIDGFASFHEVFARAFGFPDFYGRNMDAWIDCMTSLDCPGDALTTLHCSEGDVVTVQLENVADVPDEVMTALADCAAFVNWRRVATGAPPVLALSYCR